MCNVYWLPSSKFALSFSYPLAKVQNQLSTTVYMSYPQFNMQQFVGIPWGRFDTSKEGIRKTAHIPYVICQGAVETLMRLLRLRNCDQF